MRRREISRWRGGGNGYICRSMEMGRSRKKERGVQRKENKKDLRYFEYPLAYILVEIVNVITRERSLASCHYIKCHPGSPHIDL